MNKLLLLLPIGIIIIAGVTLLYAGDTPEHVPVEDIKVDVAMPSKSSRPICAETDSCYVPSTITIQAGDSVTWQNQDSAFHSVTSGFYDSRTDLFDSGHMGPDDTFTVSFEEGTHDYFCTLHPWMKGVIHAK